MAVWRPVASGVNAVVAPVMTSNVRPTSKFRTSAIDSLEASTRAMTRASRASGVRNVLRHGSMGVVHGVQAPLRLARVAAKTAALGLLTGAAGTLAAQGALRLADDQIAKLLNIDSEEVNRHLDTLFEGAGAVDPLTIYARTFDVIFDDLDEANQARGLHTAETRGEFVNEQISTHLRDDWGTAHDDPLMPGLGIPDEVADAAGKGAELITDAGFYVVDEGEEAVDTIKDDTTAIGESIDRTAHVVQATADSGLVETGIRVAVNQHPLGRVLSSLWK